MQTGEPNLYQWYFTIYEFSKHIASIEKAGTNSDPSKSIRLLCDTLRNNTPKDFRKIYLAIVLNNFIAIRNHLEHRPRQKLSTPLYLNITLDILPNFNDCIIGLYPQLAGYTPTIISYLEYVISIDSTKTIM